MENCILCNTQKETSLFVYCRCGYFHEQCFKELRFLQCTMYSFGSSQIFNPNSPLFQCNICKGRYICGGNIKTPTHTSIFIHVYLDYLFYTIPLSVLILNVLCKLNLSNIIISYVVYLFVLFVLPFCIYLLDEEEELLKKSLARHFVENVKIFAIQEHEMNLKV